MSALEQLSRMILLCRDYASESVGDEFICSKFQSTRVLCVSDAPNLQSHGGQTALFTLASLLSRMGIQVELDIPDVQLAGPQPPFTGTHVREALMGRSEMLIEGAAIRPRSGCRPDMTFVLGDTQLKRRESPHRRLFGGEWSGGIAAGVTAKKARWETDWPIGAMVSASLAAGEAFKLVVRSIPFRDDADRAYFEPSLSCEFNFGLAPTPGPQCDGFELGEVDLISAGAINQAALFALVRVPNARMSGRAMDDDATGHSNLNRNMLSFVVDVGHAKVEVISKACAPQFRLHAVGRRFTGTDPELRPLAQRVLVGVDDIPSRWATQASAPQWLAVSGTTHFNASSSEHSPDQPCCGCLHTVDDPTDAQPIPTVSFVSFWAGLAMAVRILRNALGHPYQDHQQHLWMTPLRMDLPHASVWWPVAARQECPVACARSTVLTRAS